MEKETLNPAIENCGGIMGRISFLVIKTVTIEDRPNNRTVFRSIHPCLKLLNDPIRLVEPTINKEYEVANTGETPNRYTNTGRVNIDPPPPISPNEIPINNAAM
jgi:hypothetical protein